MPDLNSVAAATGTALAPMTGGLSELLPIAVGGAEAITSIIKKKKANAALGDIAQSDPQERAFLSDIMRQRRQLMTGTAFSQPLNDLNTNLSDTLSGISKTSGGGGGAAIAGMSRALNQAGRNYGNLFTQGLQEQNYLTGLADSLTKRIAERKLSAQMARYNQLSAEAAQNKTDASANILGGIARGIGGMGKDVIDDSSYLDERLSNTDMTPLPLRKTYL